MLMVLFLMILVLIFYILAEHIHNNPKTIYYFEAIKPEPEPVFVERRKSRINFIPPPIDCECCEVNQPATLEVEA